MSIDLSKNNLSIYALPAAYILTLAPHTFRLFLTLSKVGVWDNVAPRSNIERVEGKLTKADLAMIKRASAAHLNGLEMFPLFAAANIAANVSGVPVATLNKVSLIYLALRLIYNPVYILSKNQLMGAARSLIWGGALGSCLYLLKLAGDKSFGQ